MSAAFHSCFSFIIYTCWPQSRWVCVLENSCLPLECHAIVTLPQQFITKTWHQDYFKDHQHLEFTSWVLLIAPIVSLFVLGHCPVSQILPPWQQSTSFPWDPGPWDTALPPQPCSRTHEHKWEKEILKAGTGQLQPLKPTRLYSPCQDSCWHLWEPCKYSMELNPHCISLLPHPQVGTPCQSATTLFLQPAFHTSFQWTNCF